MILKSGNLLNMARLSFRVKCNDQFQGFRTLGCCPLLFEAGIFYGMRLFIRIIHD
ncbi:MAG: hypothetical protein KHY93_06850 [Clostridiales bacterium]|nr:hypothetical protein [Clostridiales bacterium]